ncbi:MAG: glycosyltransferase [Candidatus Saganbacteria bacterium]|nr:glycosyltransferase [Candidatus Saganbacteria bacterium]
MEVRAAILRTCANNRVINRGLNGLGYLARGINRNYRVGLSRGLAQLAQHTTVPGLLEIKPDGIFIDHANKVSTNLLLIEAFLEQAVSKITISGSLSYEQLSGISRGRLAVGDGFQLDDPGRLAEQSLPEIKTRNAQQVMRMNALAALYAGLGYAAYKLGTLALSVGCFDFVDLVCSSILVFCSIVYASINVLKQKFVADSVHYKEPEISPAERAAVQGAEGPSVSVLIPAYNEPVDVLRRTLQAAGELNYTNYEIVLLLDSRPDSENYREVLAMFETEFSGRERYKVFSRKNYPEVANQKLNKADNINAFLNYAHGRTFAGSGYLDSEIVLITDADYRLRPEFLEETVPLLVRDEQTAYVMTPQNFALDQGNTVEQANAALMSSSWQQINRGVAHSARVLFGGCNSIIRVSTLREVATTRDSGEVDYFPTDTVTEDLALTLRFIERGYNSYYIPRPLAEGDPVASLGDHYGTFWRYAEGSIENTLKHTLPAFASGRMSPFSLEGMDYLYKAISPIAGASLGLISFSPLLAHFGVAFPSASIAVPLLYYCLLSNAAKTTFQTQGVRDPWSYIKVSALMYSHFPVFAHASFSAVKNYLTGQEAHFRVTRKDGARTRLPLSYLFPLLSVAGVNTYSAIAHLDRFLTTLEPAWLEAMFWSAVPTAAIAYTLGHFNGVKNTASDLVFGIKQVGQKFANWFEASYGRLGQAALSHYETMAWFLAPFS